jgi:hypothetical protein
MNHLLKSALGVLIVAAAIGGAAPTQAATIDFETGAPDLFVDTTPLTTHYSGIGVTFAGLDGVGGSILDQAGAFGINARSGVDFLAFNTEVGTGLVEQIFFAAPVSGFRIYVGSAGAATYTASAFNAADELIATTSVAGAAATYSALNLNVGGISRVIFEAQGQSYYVADDLSFSAGGVPEPATWGLLIAGFAGAGVTLRKRRVAVVA